MPLHGLSVTVVGIYYAPDSTGIAPYTTDLCRSLSLAGAAVTAVTGVPHYPQWTVAPAYRHRMLATEVRDGVVVRRTRHFVPRRQDLARRGLYEGTFWLGSLLAAARLKPDVVLAVTPNLAGAATARTLARRHRVPLGIIVQDLVGLAASQTGIRGGSGAARLVADLEARLLTAADRVAVISDAYVPVLVRAGLPAGRIARLPNYAHVEPCALPPEEARRALGWPVAGRTVLHSGNMGLKQDLGTVVETARLAAARRSDLRFVLLGDGSTRARLERQADALPNVTFVDPLPDDQYPTALAAADCLLVNERPSVLDMSLPSKLTSYLAAGRPVVAAANPAGATAAEVRRSGGGLVVDAGDPAALLDVLDRLVEDAGQRERLAERGRRYAAEELSQDAARGRLVDFVACLAAPAAATLVRAR